MLTGPGPPGGGTGWDAGGAPPATSSTLQGRQVEFRPGTAAGTQGLGLGGDWVDTEDSSYVVSTALK